MEGEASASNFDKRVAKYLGDIVSGFVDHFDPMDKANAVRILDDPKSSEADRQKALAYAAACKILTGSEGSAPSTGKKKSSIKN